MKLRQKKEKYVTEPEVGRAVNKNVLNRKINAQCEQRGGESLDIR